MLLRLVLTASLISGAWAISPTPPSDWKDGYVTANGIRIHYWRTGGAKPVMVMAHGSSDDGLCWTNFAKELTASYDIIMYDARGHGLSDPPKPGDPADVQADDLHGLIRELKLEKPIVMGHSMGSSAAAMFAAKYPDVARAIVLEDPGLGGARPNFPGTPEERRASILKRNNTSEEELVAGCMKVSPKWGQSECEFWAPSKRRHHPDTALGSATARPAMKDLLPKIKVPTLILKADAQGDLRKANDEAAKLLAKGKLVHIDGAGHNVRRENKAQALEVLRAFLAGL
jgi:pimeloyl-ACP methyl ester carboxylesterase